MKEKKTISAVCCEAIPYEPFVKGETYTFEVYELVFGSDEIVYDCTVNGKKYLLTDLAIKDHFQIL